MTAKFAYHQHSYNMDNKFTQKIREWLETPSEQRDYTLGALYLLKLSGNQIMYMNLARNPASKADFIEYQIRKYYDFRVRELTHSEVLEMEAQVTAIEQEHLSLSVEAESFTKGRRDDHDTLPDEIQACYVENLSILRQMRELHLKLRSMTLDSVTCPDSERYPFLKELIRLDKQYHANWERYDHYKPDGQ